LWDTGYYYRAVEALVHGGCPYDDRGKEMVGIGGFCWTWMAVLKSKDRRQNLRMEIVEGADHVWSGCLRRIGDVTDNWLG